MKQKRYVISVTPFVNQQNQYTATNNINMKDFTLQNVGEPTNAKDVATKEYVDNLGGGAFEVRNGGYTAKGPLYIGGNKIGGIRDPKRGGEPTNKRYVDNYVEKYVNDYIEKFKDGNGVFTLPWDVNIAGKKLSGLSFPLTNDEAATREYADKVGNDVREYTDRSSELLGERFKRLQFAFLKDNGKFVAYTPISMASQPLKDLTEPKETSDAATKKYVDDLIADNVSVGNMNGGGSPFFKENGNYQASHTINMAFKKLLNLPQPSQLTDAATKKYVDNVVRDKVEKGINQRTHLITANASYHGDLIKDDYQFTFGGGSMESYKKHDKYNGFVMPYSGYIKRFILKETGLKFPSENINDVSVKFVLNFCDGTQSVITKPEIIPLFSLNVIKNDSGEVVELGVLNIQISIKCEKKESIDDNGDIRITTPTIIYSFVSSLPVGIEKYHLSTKDILNIKSEFSTEKLDKPYLIIENKPFLFNAVSNSIEPPDFSDYSNLLSEYLNPTTECFTYLATILIELDTL